MMVIHTLTQWNATTVALNSGVMLHLCITVEAVLLQLYVMAISTLWEAMGHLILELLNDMIRAQIPGK